MSATVIGLLLAACPHSDAQAETWSSPDRPHDVRAYSVDLDAQPCPTITFLPDSHDRVDDLRRLTVDHRADAVVLTATFRDLGARTAPTTTFHLRTPDRAYLVEVDPRPKGRRPSTFFAREPHYPKPSGPCDVVVVAIGGRACAGLTAQISPSRNTVEMTVPRDCLHRPAWVRVGVDDLSFRGGAVSTDRWSRAGLRPHEYLPPYGPRVAAESS